MPPKRAPTSTGSKASGTGAKAVPSRGGKTSTSSACGRTTTQPPSRGAASTARGTGRVAPGGASTARGQGVGSVRGTGVSRGRGAPARGGKVPGSQGSKTNTGKAAGAAAASKAAASNAKPATKPQWTKEDSAARLIQCIVRGFLARRKLAALRVKHQKYLEEMSRIEKEAWRHIMLKEQKEAEEMRQREAEERRKRREEVNRQKRMLEAAFDGEIEEMEKLLKEVEKVATEEAKVRARGEVTAEQLKSYIQNRQGKLADCEDANKNTPLSEAAAGGSTGAIQMLLHYDARPNSKGAFGRTPLYRAAFAGHLETVQLLLESGGDPRLHADDGAKPEQIASKDDVRGLFEAWDIAATERALANLSLEEEKRNKVQLVLKAAETKRLTDDVTEAEREHQRWQKELKKAYQELEKRILEHDTVVAEGNLSMKDVTLQMIHDAEGELEVIKLNSEKAREVLQKARLTVREQQHEGESAESLVGLKVILRELDDVLVRDVGDKIKNSGKWPLLIDETNQVSTFLKYRDTNFLNALHSRDMQPETVRMALLGSLRYGKPTVLDMLDADMWDVVNRVFDDLQPGLLQSIMDKSILQQKVYEKLLRKEDGQAYEKKNFSVARVENFQFYVLTRLKYPPDSLVERTYPIRIIMQGAPL